MYLLPIVLFRYICVVNLSVLCYIHDQRDERVTVSLVMCSGVRMFRMGGTRALIPRDSTTVRATEEANTNDEQTKDNADHSACQINGRELNIRTREVGSESEKTA